MSIFAAGRCAAHQRVIDSFQECLLDRRFKEHLFFMSGRKEPLIMRADRRLFTALSEREVIKQFDG